MADLLWQRKQDDQNAMNSATQMLALSRTDPQTLLGYKLGQYISNYFDRGQERDANKTANNFTPEQAQHLAQTTRDNALSGQKMDAAKAGWDSLNPSAQQPFGGVLDGLPAPMQLSGGSAPDTINTGSPGDWQAMAAKYGDVGPNISTSSGLLHGIGSSRNDGQTAALSDWDKLAVQNGDVGGGLSNSINANGIAERMAQQPQIDLSGSQRLQNLQSQQQSSNSQLAAAEQQKQQQQINLIKTFMGGGSPFDLAASADKAGAAPNNETAPQQNSKQAVPAAASMDDAIKQAMLNSLAPASSGYGLSDFAASAAAMDNANGNAGITPRQPLAQDLAQNKVQNDILYLKSAYGQAQAAGNQAGMDNAHSQADMIREVAKRMGVNTASLGADNTLGQAAYKKSQDDYMEQIRRAVDPEMTMQEYFNQTYNKLRDAGYGYDVSNRVASQKAQVYQAQRLSSMTTQLGQQGLSSTGAVNNLGAQILSQIAIDSPQTYEALAKMYAMPKDEYDFNAAIKRAITNNDLQTKLAGVQSNLHMNEADHNLGNTIKLNDHNLGNSMQLEQFKSGLGIKQKQALARIELQIKGMEQSQAYGIRFNAAKQFGANDTVAGQYALGLLGKSGNKKEDGRNGVTQQNFTAAESTIKAYDNCEEKAIDANGKRDSSENPYKNSIGEARDTVDRYWAKNFDPNNYNSCMSYATYLLENNVQKGSPWSKDQVIQSFKNAFGDNADGVIDSIDWGTYFPGQSSGGSTGGTPASIDEQLKKAGVSGGD